MDKYMQTMLENIPIKTGKSLQEWFGILAEHRFDKHSAAINFLKSEYAVTHGYANTIVTLFTRESEPEQDMVALQYDGKMALFPIYEKIISVVSTFGDDVTITPKKATVSVIRKRQFALIKPATKTRIDLGLKLKDVQCEGKLEASGPFGTMCTHRIRLGSVSDIDDEVIKWLAFAYQTSV